MPKDYQNEQKEAKKQPRRAKRHRIKEQREPTDGSGEPEAPKRRAPAHQREAGGSKRTPKDSQKQYLEHLKVGQNSPWSLPEEVSGGISGSGAILLRK